MTKPKDDGGPFHPPTFDSRNCPAFGASFRAVAAMHAMAAMISTYTHEPPDAERCAYYAVKSADALIAELKK